jgi:hypothetical protein
VGLLFDEVAFLIAQIRRALELLGLDRALFGDAKLVDLFGEPPASVRGLTASG